MTDIIAKYNAPVPRYTSYPPANFFHHDFGEQELMTAISESNTQSPSHLSFYIHFPYCDQLCHYCGCNSYLRSKNASDQEYIDTVLREIDLVTEHIDPTRKIAQIHFGGGSPTSAAPAMIQSILEHLTSRFTTIDRPEIAIECHPGNLTLQDYDTLIGMGFNRMSIGIQDFDSDVLRSANRVKPLTAIEDVSALLREHGIGTNLDFIYGLPHQTPDSFVKTIQKAISLRPDRLVTFSYAHVPSIFPRQKNLEKEGLPSSRAKEAMYEGARRCLLSSGYKQVGLDHFILPSDELYEAARSHTLHRNFQGYCTRRTTGQVYAFGVSAISQLATAYAQNTKSIRQYIRTVNDGHIPVSRGYRLSDEEQITREVITDLMCNEKLSWSSIAERTGHTVDEVIAATAYDPIRMQEMEQDGILQLLSDGIEMAQKGSPFLRYAAAAMDKLQLNTTKIFSKPI